jgi:amino acid transporter
MESSERRSGGLARKLGTFEAVTIGIGGMIGGAIFEAIGVAAGIAGPSLVLTFCLGAVMAALTGYSYGKLGARFPEAGGSFSYISRAFKGRGFRVMMGYLIWFAYIAAAALYSLGFTSYARVFLPWLPQPVVMLALVLGFTWVNLRGVKETGMAQNLMVSLKVSILLLLVSVGWGAVDFDNYVPLFPFGPANTLLAIGIIFIGYEGFDIIGTSGEELNDPAKQIPRSIFISIAIVSFLYISVSAVSIGVLGYRGLQEASAPLTAVAERSFGRMGAVVLGLGGVFSTASAFNAAMYGASRVAYSLGRNNVLPKKACELSRSAAPAVAIVSTGGLIALLAIASLASYEAVKFAASLSSASFMFVFLLVNLANYRLRHITRPNRWLMWTTIALYVFSMAILYVADPMSWLLVGAWVLAAFVLDFGLRSRLIGLFYYKEEELSQDLS